MFYRLSLQSLQQKYDHKPFSATDNANIIEWVDNFNKISLHNQ